MKNTTLLLLALLLSVPAMSQSQKEKEVESKITKVTVFMTGAQVNRTAKVELNAGRTTLLFNGLSSLLDESTINLNAGNDVSVMSIKHRKDYLSEKKDDPKIKRLKDSISYLNTKIEELIVRFQILQQRESYLIHNRKMETGSQHFDPTKFVELAKYYENQFKDIQQSRYQLTNQQKDLITRKLKFLNELRARENPKSVESSTVEVLVNSGKKAIIDVTLQYSVTGAGWTPSYDIRVTEVNQPLNLIYKANVAQNTGEDWDDVKLVFSNGDPGQNNTLPKLPVYYLSYVDPSAFMQKSNIMYDDAKQNMQLIRDKVIRGRVLDSETGLPLPYATISVNTGLVATTDENGEFEAEVSESNYSITVGYIGYTSISHSLVNGPNVVYLKSNVIASYRDKVKSDAMAGSFALGSGQAMNLYDTFTLDVDNDGVASFYDVEEMSYANKSVQRMSATYKWGRSKSKRAEYQSMARPIENNITLEFEMDEKYTIKSNGKPEILEMTRLSIPANYQYYTVPKIEEAAFLMARVIDWTKYQLLPGETNLYLGNTYVGKSELDVYYVSDTLSINLGRDPSVTVKREKVKEFSGRQFLGTDNVDKRQFRIKVMNSKSTEIEIVVIDQIPMSGNKEITVEVGGISGAGYNAETGEVRKVFTVGSGGIKEMDIKYTVKYPKGKAVNLE